MQCNALDGSLGNGLLEDDGTSAWEDRGERRTTYLSEVIQLNFRTVADADCTCGDLEMNGEMIALNGMYCLTHIVKCWYEHTRQDAKVSA